MREKKKKPFYPLLTDKGRKEFFWNVKEENATNKCASKYDFMLTNYHNFANKSVVHNLLYMFV